MYHLSLFNSIAKTISEQFAAFHRDNPHVYNELVELARTAKAFGKQRYGIAALFEVLRWKRMQVDTDDQFKLNNNYRSHYARLIMSREPDLKDFFETRELKS